MRISLKVLGFLWVGLFLIIGGLLFNAYSKFKPETFIALLTEQVQKNYPGAKLNVGKISYRFSLDFNLNLQDIHLRRSDKLLGSIGEIELKVPWWLLLANRGNAHINLKNLDIYIDHQGQPVVPEKTSLPKPKNVIKVTLPSYMSEAKYTLRAKNITIKDIHNSRRYFVLSKLLVREFHYGKNSAFELNIPISISQNEVQYKSELWLFGDITPEPNEWKLNFRGEFRTKENNDKFQIEDVVIGGSGNFSPSSLNFNTQVNLEIEKQKIGSGELKAGQNGVLVNLNFQKFPINYFSFIYEEIKNPYLRALEGESEGSIVFQKSFEAATASINGKLNFDGVFNLSDKDTIPGKWQLGFDNNRWEVSFISPKGEASFFRRSFIDLKKNKVTQFVEEIGFSGLDLNLTIQPLTPVVAFIKEDPLTFYSTTISYKNCLLDDEVLNGNFKYGFSPVQKFYQGHLSKDDSFYKVEYSKKALQNNLELEFKNFKWNSAYQFLSPLYSASGGSMNGSLAGKWDEVWENGIWKLGVSHEQAQNVDGLVQEFVNKSFAYFNLIPEKYSKQEINIIGKNQLFTLKSLLLDNPESVKMTGQLSTKEKSFLTLSYPKNKRFKPFRKEVLEPYWMQKDPQP